MLMEHSDVIPIPPLAYPLLPRSNSDDNRKYGAPEEAACGFRSAANPSSICKVSH